MILVSGRLYCSLIGLAVVAVVKVDRLWFPVSISTRVHSVYVTSVHWEHVWLLSRDSRNEFHGGQLCIYRKRRGVWHGLPLTWIAHPKSIQPSTIHQHRNRNNRKSLLMTTFKARFSCCREISLSFFFLLFFLFYAVIYYLPVTRSKFGTRSFRVAAPPGFYDWKKQRKTELYGCSLTVTRGDPPPHSYAITDVVLTSCCRSGIKASCLLTNVILVNCNWN